MPYVILSLSLINFLLGVFIFRRTEKNPQSSAFLAFAVSISVWIFCNFLLRISPSLSMLRVSYSLGLVVATVALVWTFFFLKKDLHYTVKFILIPFSVVFSLVTFFTEAIVFKLDSVSTWGYVGEVGKLFPLYSTYFSVIIILIVLNLVSGYRSTNTEIPKQQISIILFGLFIFAGASFWVSFVLPSFFHTLEFTTIDNFSSSFFLLAISFAILKYHLFNIKLILVEIAVLLLNLFLFLNVFTSNVRADFILNSSIFVGILFFSIFLLRGIYKDIRDRGRIEELAYEMEVSNEKLKMMEQSKTEFISIASHQLRTPLTVIKGYASMILEGTFGPLTERARDAVEKLYKSSEKIVDLVADLLTVSRLEQGRLTPSFEPVEMTKFMGETLTEESENIKDAGLEISFDTNISKQFLVNIDEKKFKQVIKHLLANAIQYTASPGTISVSISEDMSTQKIIIAISDTGVGMTARQIREIIEHFNLNVNVLNKEIEAYGKIRDKVSGTLVGRSDSKTPGIGLYIAQEILRAHKGKLRIESSGENRGSTFIVELPRIMIPRE